MAWHARLVTRTLEVTAQEGLSITDGFPLRFEVMILFVSSALFHLLDKKKALSDAKKVAEELWVVTIEGFEESLRDRGVSDLRISARMRTLISNATARRNAYVEAWQHWSDATAPDTTSDVRQEPELSGGVMSPDGKLREAIARNVLNGSEIGDFRVDRMLKSARDILSDIR